jgi:hypothetical protein
MKDIPLIINKVIAKIPKKAFVQNKSTFLEKKKYQ